MRTPRKVHGTRSRPVLTSPLAGPFTCVTKRVELARRVVTWRARWQRAPAARGVLRACIAAICDEFEAYGSRPGTPGRWEIPSVCAAFLWSGGDSTAMLLASLETLPHRRRTGRACRGPAAERSIRSRIGRQQEKNGALLSSGPEGQAFGSSVFSICAILFICTLKQHRPALLHSCRRWKRR
jgi:hypothetical protein